MPDVELSWLEARLTMRFQQGDRVRIVQAKGPYTGCRGTIADASAVTDVAGAGVGAEVGAGVDDGQLPLGYYVAIDGENGVVRPFLVEALERIGAVSSRRRETAADRVER